MQNFTNQQERDEYKIHMDELKAHAKWQLREIDRVYGGGCVSYILYCDEQSQMYSQQDADDANGWWDEENSDEDNF